ncbi:MAG TPA: tRNA uridine-5-carboxymethylaminomethyl(34) synthesis GTPase MnmE [Lachnospiraceae bacterium]|nr:tRNA uridine-5-carboxymethylaminomethyl(34) synthesis GTPase MnmE [Lachnospiraceae bacterium]
MEIRDTIAAIATGLTDSGIGIVRISGENAAGIGNEIFRSPSGRKILCNAADHMLYYGYAYDTERDFTIDEVMAVVMRAPKSFTGEDTVEIQCHGGVFVMQKILDAALRCGARLAEPGEFTKRAFLNGRIDLSRAEAVMDVIRSENDYALGSSVNQLKGMLSEEIRRLRGEILYEVAFIESAIDDPEHFNTEGYQDKLSEKTDALMGSIRKLIDTADNGRLIKEGINTVIVGKPNVGKSSLLNCLVGEERAIVTDVAGTTRDVLRETVRLGNICLNVVDTAGIRETEDTVEKIGVKRALEYADDADLVIYVVDASVALDENDREIISFIRDKNRIVLLNKSDLTGKVTEQEIEDLFEAVFEKKDALNQPLKIVKTSFKDGSGMEEFELAVKEMFFRGEIKSSNEIVITNMRHKKALEEAYASLALVRKSLDEGMPEDFYSIDLMDAYASLGRITGEEVDDDLIEEIFSKFCMGK